jgi:hypothetical protein
MPLVCRALKSSEMLTSWVQPGFSVMISSMCSLMARRSSTLFIPWLLDSVFYLTIWRVYLPRAVHILSTGSSAALISSLTGSVGSRWIKVRATFSTRAHSIAFRRRSSQSESESRATFNACCPVRDVVRSLTGGTALKLLPLIFVLVGAGLVVSIVVSPVACAVWPVACAAWPVACAVSFSVSVLQIVKKESERAATLALYHFGDVATTKLATAS